MVLVIEQNYTPFCSDLQLIPLAVCEVVSQLNERLWYFNCSAQFIKKRKYYLKRKRETLQNKRELVDNKLEITQHVSKCSKYSCRLTLWRRIFF
jgi:hypothetical protein